MRKVILYVAAAFVICLFGGIVYMMTQGGIAASTAAMRQVTDSTGETMEIPEHPQRVVFLNASNMDMYVAAGGASQVVGRPTSQSLSPELAKAVADVVSFHHKILLKGMRHDVGGACGGMPCRN